MALRVANLKRLRLGINFCAYRQLRHRHKSLHLGRYEHSWCYEDVLRRSWGYRRYFSCSAGDGDSEPGAETAVVSKHSVSNADVPSSPAPHVDPNAIDANSNSSDANSDQVSTPGDTSDYMSHVVKADSPERQPQQSDMTNSKSIEEQNASSTLDLSNLSWSNEEGIVIYPDIHFDKKRTDLDSKPKGKLSDDATPQRQDYDLQALLHNIQKSRAEKEEALTKEKRTTMMTVEELVQFLREHNAKDVFVVQLPRDLEYVDYFIICSGTGRRHIGRMADSVVSELKGVRVGKEHRKVQVEGRDSEDWMAVDVGTMVVHFMLEEPRKNLELEMLWTLGEKYDDQCRIMLKEMRD